MTRARGLCVRSSRRLPLHLYQKIVLPVHELIQRPHKEMPCQPTTSRKILSRGRRQSTRLLAPVEDLWGSGLLRILKPQKVTGLTWTNNLLKHRADTWGRGQGIFVQMKVRGEKFDWEGRWKYLYREWRSRISMMTRWLSQLATNSSQCPRSWQILLIRTWETRPSVQGEREVERIPIRIENRRSRQRRE